MYKHLARCHPGRKKEKASKCLFCPFSGKNLRKHLDTKHKDEPDYESAIRELVFRRKTKKQEEHFTEK